MSNERAKRSYTSRMLGMKRRRIGAAMKTIERYGAFVVVPEEAASRGFRFSTAKETAEQKAALYDVFLRYVRLKTAKELAGLPVVAIGDAIGLKKTQAAKIVKEAESLDRSALADMVLNILGGMMTGKIAGPRGVSRNQTNDWLLRAVDTFNLRAFWNDLPSSFHRIDLVEVPRDAKPCTTTGCRSRIIADGRGAERTVHVVRVDEDGAEWAEDWSRLNDRELFEKSHAAFRLAYRKREEGR